MNKGPKVTKDLVVIMHLRALKDQSDPRDHRVLKEIPALKVRKVLSDQRGLLVIQVKMPH